MTQDTRLVNTDKFKTPSNNIHDWQPLTFLFISQNYFFENSDQIGMGQRFIRTSFRKSYFIFLRTKTTNFLKCEWKINIEIKQGQLLYYPELDSLAQSGWNLELYIH